jgi:hypothetical protein
MLKTITDVTDAACSDTTATDITTAETTGSEAADVQS